MAKIIDGDDLVVSSSLVNLGTDGNIWIDTSAKTFQFAVQGAFTSFKEGVTLQALYSKFIKLWETSAYNQFPFPMYAIDALSGQFQFGTDGSSFSGWGPLDDTTRQALRDGGWDEYNNVGTKTGVYAGLVALASGFPSGAQFYYQKETAGSALNFTFDDSPNEGILVSDTAQTYFKMYCREPNYTYDDAILTDVGLDATGPNKISLPISVSPDLKTYSGGSPVLDTAMASAPYSNLNIYFYSTNQTGYDVNASAPFRIVVDNTVANATLEQIYTWVQYLLRQTGDINNFGGGVVGDAGVVTGKTQASLMSFTGDALTTTQGVFINGVIDADLNRVTFTDQNSAAQVYPFVSAGTMNFNSTLTDGGTGYYRMYFLNDDAGDNLGNDYGTANAITVNDKDGVPIQGAISAASISFSYDYTNNVQRGTGSNGTDAPIVLVAGNIGKAKPVVVTGVTIDNTKTIVVTATAEQDRAYTP